MKTIKSSKKWFFAILSMIFFSVVVWAVIIDTDTFDSNTDIWSGTNVTWNAATKRLFINTDNTAIKTYDFGSTYANKDVTITLTATKASTWESSDRIQITANGTQVYNSITDGSISFNATLDSSGKLILQIMPNTNASAEDLYIDNISIDYDPVYTSDGFVDFSLINPSDTRNIIGNYAIAGNTVMCLTEKTSGYGGTCHGQNDYKDQTSNLKVSKYIDIDGDSSTWNSTSSYVNLPNTYAQGSDGIAWVGLFWQGRIATDKDYAMRYGVSSGSTYSFTETGSGSTITNANIKAASVNNIKLKIDTGSYNDIQASTVNSYTSSNGVTYAAFADVTSIARSANMNIGKHVFTVANLVTNEGREASPGLFGGWSLVVIYKENSLGRARNISIYNGLTSPGTNTPPVHISGLKLPKSGAVSAQLSVFAGEGESLYEIDWMKLSDNATTGYNFLPGATDNNNIFDAVMDGVTRDNISGQSNNLQTNNNGVDIDKYDISSLMTGYRDTNSDIEDVYVKLYSNNDYITPSMLAFSAELYRPNLCYDFEATQGDYVTIPVMSDRSFTPLNTGDSFNLKLFVRSQESDFPINSANLEVDFNRSGILQFNLSKTEVQPPHVNAYEPAILIDGTTKNISIGSNNSITGGIIGAFESIYAKISHDMITGTSLPMKFDVTINGSVVLDASTSMTIPFALSTSDGSLERCKGSAIYNPRWLQFNIERPNTSNDYRLYTQVTGKPFAMDVVSYNASSNYTDHESLNNVVTELELIDIGSMENNASMGYDTVCEDVSKTRPWLNNQKVFQKFDGSYRVNVDIPSQLNTYAIKNAAMRVWALTDGNGTIVHHTCTDVDHSCFKTLYTTDYSSLLPNNCGTSCGTSNTDIECYECLKTYYATPACSRDNFSVRPDGFRIRVGDNNETTNSVSNWIIANQNNPSRVNLVSGYNYPIEINATRYGTSEIAQGYYQTNDDENDILNGNFSLLKVTADLLAIIFDDDTSTCNDTKHVQLKVDILNGVNNPTSSYIHRENVGNFNLAMIDNTWTQVDQAGYAYKPFSGADCASGNGDSDAAIVGCSTLSDKGTSDFSTVPISFVPAKIAVNMSASSPLDLGWLYMGDVDENMSVKFDGNLTAVNYKNVATSNFVTGCAAKDVNLSMDFNNSMSSMVAENTGDHNTTIVGLKYRLTSNNDTNYTDGDANASGFMQIKESKFLKDNNGTSPTEILYNIEKIFDKVLNPVKIWFKTLTSILIDDDDKNVTAYAETKNNFTIDDNKTYNQPYIFLYGRVYSPLEAETPTILTLNTETALSVLAYCDSSLVDCSQYGAILDTTTIPITNWYRVKAHTSSIMGVIQSLSANKAGTTISPDTNVSFVNNGTTNNITIGYPMINRTQIVRITASPSSWLKYHSTDISGNPFFDIKFAIPSYEWFGAGKTGDVVNTRPTPDSKRLSW